MLEQIFWQSGLLRFVGHRQTNRQKRRSLQLQDALHLVLVLFDSGQLAFCGFFFFLHLENSLMNEAERKLKELQSLWSVKGTFFSNTNHCCSN